MVGRDHSLEYFMGDIEDSKTVVTGRSPYSLG